MKNLYLPISIIIAGLIIAGAIFYTKSPKEEPSLLKEEKKEEVAEELQITEKDHIRGDFSAPVTIIEYSDFQCSFCASFHSTVKQILTDYPDKVRWVYKHFPLDQIHSEATPAAEASECAWEQKGNDGFWQFADLLFENQSRLGEALYKELAAQMELDLDQFNDCLSSRKYKDKVETDYQEGIEKGVRGTPNSFVNGEIIPGALPYESLKEVIDKALANLE